MLINPPPLTDLLKDDMILMMGNTDYANDNQFQRVTGDTTPEQYSKEDVFDNIPQNDEILELIKQYIIYISTIYIYNILILI